MSIAGRQNKPFYEQNLPKPKPVPGKYATGAKRGRTCNQCQARENMQPVPGLVTCAERGKNMQPVPGAENLRKSL